MKKQINISGYIRKKYDPEGAPSPVTVRRWCQNGDIAAEKTRGSWFVFIEEDKIETTGNPLIDRVLAG